VENFAFLQISFQLQKFSSKKFLGASCIKMVESWPSSGQGLLNISNWSYRNDFSNILHFLKVDSAAIEETNK